jgi:hypothetical protein
MTMRFLALALLPIAGIAFAQSGQGNEIPGERMGDGLVYRTRGFDGVALGTAASVDVRVGPTWSVRATGPAAALANLRVERTGSTLALRRPRGMRNADWRAEQQVRVLVTLPRLAEASVGGAGRMRVDQMSGKALSASVGGSGSLAFARVAVDAMDVAIGGSGSIAVAGTAQRLKISTGGSGGFVAPELHVRTAEVSAAGSGSVRTRVDGAATVSLVGSGSIDLGPGARCSTTKMGSGRVTCGR